MVEVTQAFYSVHGGRDKPSSGTPLRVTRGQTTCRTSKPSPGTRPSRGNQGTNYMEDKEALLVTLIGIMTRSEHFLEYMEKKTVYKFVLVVDSLGNWLPFILHMASMMSFLSF